MFMEKQHFVYYFGQYIPNDDVWTNICYTNKKRKEINLKCMHRWLKLNKKTEF